VKFQSRLSFSLKGKVTSVESDRYFEIDLLVEYQLLTFDKEILFVSRLAGQLRAFSQHVYVRHDGTSMCVLCMDSGVDFRVHCTNVRETNILRMIHIDQIITNYVCFASPWAQSTDFHRLQTRDLM
jgi:hypothetical protein